MTIAFIPLRAGGKRIGFDKETALLGDRPLMAYTIEAAVRSSVFSEVIAYSHSEPHLEEARRWGAVTPYCRSPDTARDDAPDIDWVLALLAQLLADRKMPATFAILRVTSPFRSANSIANASMWFRAHPWADSLRAVTRVSEHPGKMWVLSRDVMHPLLPAQPDAILPWHSRPTQFLPPVYIQTAGMEFAAADRVWRMKSISGSRILPWVLEGDEGLDINTMADWVYAESVVHRSLS